MTSVLSSVSESVKQRLCHSRSTQFGLQTLLSASLCSTAKTLLSFSQHDPSYNANMLISEQRTLCFSLEITCLYL